MEIVFDIITVVIILSSIYLGYKKGLVNVGISLFAIIISLLVTVILYSPITHLIINNTEIDENIEAIIIENGTSEYAKGIVQETQNVAVQTAARSIATNVVGIGVMVVLFVVTRIALKLLMVFTNIITKIPIIKQCNELAGIAYGALRGLVIIYGILAIIFFVGSVSGNTAINTVIENSYITKFFYDNNIILKLL